MVPSKLLHILLSVADSKITLIPEHHVCLSFRPGALPALCLAPVITLKPRLLAAQPRQGVA